MAFSNEDLLSWFCATNPIPDVPAQVQVLKGPGHAKMAHIEKLKAQASAEENAKSKHKTPPTIASPLRPSDSQSYYQKMSALQSSSEFYDDTESTFEETDYTEYEYEDDIGPGKPFNPKANPGDDDYEINLDAAHQVYDEYSFDYNSTRPLPIANHRKNILRTIERNSVTVIQGETGSGKSTQVAQYILDHHANRRQHCNIVCTQPRRIAATSITKFVTQCRGWTVGDLVGYQIGMDKKVSEDTRLTFVTTGILLEKMINMKNLNQYTHVILDEVHERDKDTDFCLLIVRKLLRTNSKHVKVILMSATIEAPMFASYFSTKVGGLVQQPPLVMVEGRTFPVLEFFLEDIRHIGTCQRMDAENPRISKDTIKLACDLIKYFDEVETQDPAYGKGEFTRGTILIFLPGMPEIKLMEEAVNMLTAQRLTPIPLHSSISPENQHKVFYKPEVGKRKVILATNIAESSITVPDIKYVIDFCLVKQLMCDWQTKYVCLRTVWASQASLTQRKGRAGRVSQGRCYRLITRDFLVKHVPEYSTPEMLRCPLESVILKVKKLDLGEPISILSSALQPPKLVDIERAILNLKEVGAITVMLRGEVHPYDGDLTFVGKILETLPIDVRLGKLVILGHVFGCLESSLVIAAALSVKTIFSRDFGHELNAYRSKRAWAESSASDCIAFLNAYKEWLAYTDRSRRRSDAEFNWCKRNLLQKNAMHEVADLVKELTARLARHSIKPMRSVLERARDPHDLFIIKLVLCGAFYPNYFRWGAADEEVNQKAMSGHDPRTTVMLSSAPAGSERYSKQICQMFNDCGRGKALHFDGMKVFVEFERPHPSHSQPVNAVEPVLEAVHIALKKRHDRKKLSIVVKDRDKQERGIGSDEQSKDSWMFPNRPSQEMGWAPNGVSGEEVKMKQMTLPETDSQQIIITEYVNAGHFWAQFADRATTHKLQSLFESISHQNHIHLVAAPNKMVGMYCLAPFYADGAYYRARIECVHVTEEQSSAEVVFVDYGNMEWVSLKDLCELSPAHRRLEMQAVECFLTSVKPSVSLSSDGKWSPEANIRLKQLTDGKYLMADVYSEVNGTLRVELYDTNSSEDILVNEVLVKEGFAVRCEEPYQSRLCHVQAKEAKASEAKLAAERARERRGKMVRPTKYQTMTKTVEWISDRMSRGKPSYVTERETRVELRGPDNLYEVTFYSVTSVGGFRPARVERDSVNCIVVDNEPQDKHERLMTAAHVALNPAGNTCIARHTTLMPNIHGLIHLVTLLFAPTIEMRTDELKRQYTGALCGLGFDPATGESIYSEHDVEITFDTVISQKDLKMINSIRMAINLAIGSEEAIAEWCGSTLMKIQARARELVKELILITRDPTVPCPSVVHGWNQVAREDILEADSENADLDDNTLPLFPLHSGINISEERIDKQRSTRVLLMREKMKKLHLKASESTDHERLICELCNARCNTPQELLSHLDTKMHKASEEELFKDDLELDMTSEQLSNIKLM